MSSDSYKLDIFVASNIGTFKHIRYDSDPKKKKSIIQLQDIKSIEKNNGITCIDWIDDEQTKVVIGRKNRTIQTYDIRSKSYSSPENIDFGEGDLNSVVALDNDRIAASVSSGVVRIWKPTSSKGAVIETGGDIDRIKYSNNKTIGTGGKENNLKLWDLETQAMVFQAKNVPHDWLQLRVPIWVSDICFLPEYDGKVVGICSRYGVVRLYDTRTQRRPVSSVELENQAASTIAIGHREKHVIVGTGRGLLNLIDLRMKGKLDKSYKGAVGSITGVTCCPQKNIVISSSLDRHLRFHDLESKKLVYKQYLTSKLTCFLLRTVDIPLKPDESVDTTIKEEVEECEDAALEVSDPEYENMFLNMEVIGEDDNNIKSQGKKRKKEAGKKSTTEKLEKVKRRKGDEIVENEIAPSLDESIKKLLKNTEKQKRRLEKERKKKRSKSLFFRGK